MTCLSSRVGSSAMMGHVRTINSQFKFTLRLEGGNHKYLSSVFFRLDLFRFFSYSNKSYQVVQGVETLTLRSINTPAPNPRMPAVLIQTRRTPDPTRSGPALAGRVWCALINHHWSPGSGHREWRAGARAASARQRRAARAPLRARERARRVARARLAAGRRTRRAGRLRHEDACSRSSGKELATHILLKEPIPYLQKLLDPGTSKLKCNKSNTHHHYWGHTANAATIL